MQANKKTMKQSIKTDDSRKKTGGSMERSSRSCSTTATIKKRMGSVNDQNAPCNALILGPKTEPTKDKKKKKQKKQKFKRIIPKSARSSAVKLEKAKQDAAKDEANTTLKKKDGKLKSSNQSMLHEKSLSLSCEKTEEPPVLKELVNCVLSQQPPALKAGDPLPSSFNGKSPRLKFKIPKKTRQLVKQRDNLEKQKQKSGSKSMLPRDRVIRRNRPPSVKLPHNAPLATTACYQFSL